MNTFKGRLAPAIVVGHFLGMIFPGCSAVNRVSGMTSTKKAAVPAKIEKNNLENQRKCPAENLVLIGISYDCTDGTTHIGTQG